MQHDLKKYFRSLNLVREDIREELDLLGVSSNPQRICDIGCGSGLTTFALALEVDESACYGIDFFDSEIDLNKLYRYIKGIQQICNGSQSPESYFNDDLCKLYQNDRLPSFVKGNIVLNKGIPGNIDLVYCKKLLINIRDKQYANVPSGKEALLSALNNIAGSLRAEGKLCLIEYDREFALEKIINESRLEVIKRTQLQRQEIRSRGRTNVDSRFTLYLCQNQE